MTVKYAYAVADPRSGCERREGSLGVRGWAAPSAPVIAHGRAHNGRLGSAQFSGSLYVTPWPEPSHTVLAASGSKTRMAAAVADPRIPAIAGAPIDVDERRPTHLVIRAADGTWHRPLTTLELAVLQGLPAVHRGAWLDFGLPHGKTRQLVGNMVPPPAAEAIARSCAATLRASAEGGLLMSCDPVWVEEACRRCNATGEVTR